MTLNQWQIITHFNNCKKFIFSLKTVTIFQPRTTSSCSQIVKKKGWPIEVHSRWCVICREAKGYGWRQWRYLVYEDTDLSSFFKEGGVPDKPLRRARLEAACFHLKQRLSLCWDDKFLLSSQRPFPSGCLWVYMNFSNSLGSDRGASPSCRLLTHLPSVFFPPQDHCLQRRWQNKGSDRQKSAVAMHPLSQPPSPTPTLCALPHTFDTCAQTYTCKLHASILMSNYTHADDCQQASPAVLQNRPAYLKKMFHYYNRVFKMKRKKNRIIH